MALRTKRFSDELKKEAKLAINEFVKFHREVAVFVYGEAVRNSRVWTGRFRGSHNMSIGAPNTDTLPVHPDVLSGKVRWPVAPSKPFAAQSVAEIRRSLLPLRAFGTIYLTNALPYASFLEAKDAVYARALAAADARFANVRVVRTG